jgi:hypothetical protein
MIVLVDTPIWSLPVFTTDNDFDLYAQHLDISLFKTLIH